MSHRIVTCVTLSCLLAGCATSRTYETTLDGGGTARAIETELSSARPNSLEAKMARQERRIADICAGAYEFVEGDLVSLVATPHRFYLVTMFRCTSDPLRA